jgi:hypothetical protein
VTGKKSFDTLQLCAGRFIREIDLLAYRFAKAYNVPGRAIGKKLITVQRPLFCDIVRTSICNEDKIITQTDLRSILFNYPHSFTPLCAHLKLSPGSYGIGVSA